MDGLTGQRYLATRGLYQGQYLTVLGRCRLLPDDDVWDVQTESGNVWFVEGHVLRRLFGMEPTVRPGAEILMLGSG